MPDLRLGFRIDPASGKPGEEPFTLDSADLTTHGTIVGMTGSGKTGLAIVLLEEALLAGIPALVLDPKGDMANLLLTFPDLAPADFRPWVDPDEARREGVSPDELAASAASSWREGLAASGIGPERIAALRAGAELAVYTPGSEAGLPLNVIGSLAAPPLSWETEAETLRDEIEGVVTSLLGLVGIEADPLASREFVLLSNVVEAAWRVGRTLDLATLIAEVQSPPFRKLGVFDLESFFPEKERTALALRLNALAASTAFAAWGRGEPLDPGALLRAPDGKPRAAIVYLAHLSEQERQFVVTLVLSRLVTWMRGQPGTSELRALAYMDEVYGFAPPTAMPPAKKPILTILKQGRAFGVGLVLATQNPVDLDYKAMANAGTWMVGRLQTENDKARVLEGLEPAAGGADLKALDAAIGGLGKRQFMVVSAKSSQPVVFQTRWAMSYLRGPLTKDQVAALTRGEAAASAPATPEAAPPPVEAQALPEDATPVAPPVADGVPVAYVDPAAGWASRIGAVAGGTRLRAYLAARVAVRFDDPGAGIDEAQEYEALYGPLDEGVDLSNGLAVDYDDRDFGAAPPTGAAYVLPDVPLGKARFFRTVERDLKRQLTETLSLELLRNRKLKLVQRPGEGEEAFRERCDQAAQAAADAEAAKLRERLEAHRDRLDKALELARRRIEELDADERARQASELTAGAGAVLDALLGGRRSARSIARAAGALASRGGTSARARARRETAETKAAQIEGDLQELEQEILDEVAAIDAKWEAVAADLETLSIRPEAADVRVARLAVVWSPTA